MNKIKFKENDTFLPVTMEQFEALTNEILEAINQVCAPHFLTGDYAAQVLMSAIHALDHKHGYIKKNELFESCINRISCHVTYHAVQEIQKRLNPGKEAPSTELDEDESNVSPLTSELISEEAH